MTIAQIVPLVLGSSLLSGFAAGVVTLLSGRWERVHRTNEREAIASHEARLRQEKAHDDARETFLEFATRFRAWVSKHLADVDAAAGSMNFKYLGTMTRMPESRDHALDLLLRIVHEHPTTAVRRYANDLYQDLYEHYEEFELWNADDPEWVPNDKDTLQAVDWLSRTEHLIELIHSREADRHDDLPSPSA